MTKLKPDHDHDPNPDPANDNGRAIAPAPNASALASTALTALAAAFKTVDTTSIGGRPIHPLMQFKSREGGVWMFGVRRTIPEPDSLWAVNPATFQWGWVCWGDASKILGEKLVPISEPLPDVTDAARQGLPVAAGNGGQHEVRLRRRCRRRGRVQDQHRQAAGENVIQLIEAVRDRLGGQHEGKVSPIVRLENSSYGHEKYGKT